MNVRITSDDRELILRIMREELGDEYTCSGIPDFACTVNGFTLLRSGYLEFDDGDPRAASLIDQLIRLCLCEEMVPRDPRNASAGSEPAPDSSDIQIPSDFCYSLKTFDHVSLLNLFCILSARQKLINQAIGARNAFRISHDLMESLLSHPPADITGFTRALYGRDDEYDGIRISGDCVGLTGFRKGRSEETHIHAQLAALIVKYAISKQWIKPFTPNVRNRKYAFRTWLNSIGMKGPAYEEARRVLLDRLPGRSDQRKIPFQRVAGGQP